MFALRGRLDLVENTQHPRRIQEDGRTSKGQGTKRRGKKRMSLLVAIGTPPGLLHDKGAATGCRISSIQRGNQLELQMALDELAEFFAVFVAHVHEFDTVAIRTDVANDGCEIDFAKTGADFELDGVADA